MASALYTLFADVLALCQTMGDDLTALLDPEAGFAPRLRQICHDQLAEIEENDDGSSSQADRDVLRLEENTWGLLQALVPARKTKPPPFPTARALLSENPYTPTSTLAQAIMNASPRLTELIAVREWLHDTAPHPQHPEATTGYWKFTKLNVMQSLRIGGGLRDASVKHMDPDVIDRESGKNLAPDDENYDRTLVQSLYGYVRAGRLDDAVDLCRKAHQPWRAASIRGSLLFQWQAISSERLDSNVGDADGDLWKGNRHRDLWKTSCTRAILNKALPESERVLYAALAPSPETATVLKEACRTWEDHLWVETSIMCEEKLRLEMIILSGGFWEGGLPAVEKAQDTLREAIETEDDEWEREADAALDKVKSVQVREGPPADHAFHVSQLQIILDRTTPLLEDFADRLKGGSFTPAMSEYSTMCRFFAHLCLFFQMIDISVPLFATQVILEAYLQVLEAAGQRDLIAMYAGALGDNAVERYAMFLASLDLSTDIEERKLALARARDHRLDMDRVAIATAERTIDKAFENLPPLEGPLPSVIAMQAPPSDAELLLLRSIEWTTFMETTYETALEQANVILRYFLASGRILPAKFLSDALPLELMSIVEPEERATQYLHYRQFFVIWETLERVVDCQSLEVQKMSRDTRSAWLEDYKALTTQARDQILKLLTSEWLVTDVERSGGDQCRRELIRIRQIYIPELIIRLHSLLVSSHHRIPENLKYALDLANIVADSRYKLYEDFVNEHGRRLGEYLGAVRQAVLVGLEEGGSDPFRLIYANF